MSQKIDPYWPIPENENPLSSQFLSFQYSSSKLKKLALFLSFLSRKRILEDLHFRKTVSKDLFSYEIYNMEQNYKSLNLMVFGASKIICFQEQFFLDFFQI